MFAKWLVLLFLFLLLNKSLLYIFLLCILRGTDALSLLFHDSRRTVVRKLFIESLTTASNDHLLSFECSVFTQEKNLFLCIEQYAREWLRARITKRKMYWETNIIKCKGKSTTKFLQTCCFLCWTKQKKRENWWE